MLTDTEAISDGNVERKNQDFSFTLETIVRLYIECEQNKMSEYIKSITPAKIKCAGCHDDKTRNIQCPPLLRCVHFTFFFVE